ncbi:hypothetical protein K1T71_013625 [Dendrolimus kikuchii]|uniref:Uncharacterized protein n=1 Tax=Dendrolimus kikuchii TaxID=765133 RepID=A0ACC1CGZ4_9NEOP|nr:hypothetical protein K1T71_013625 [Dendrolimus kikuchii]
MSLVIISFFVICFIYCISTRKTKKIYNLPPPPVYPGAVPIFGHTLNLFGNNKSNFSVETLQTDQQSYSRIFNIIGINKNWFDQRSRSYEYFLSLADPEDCNTVANTCLQRVPYGFAKFWLGDGLLTAPLPIWKVHRKLLNKALKLEGFLVIFNKNSRKLVESLIFAAEGESFDPNPYIRNMTLDAICSAAMGCDVENFAELKKSYIQALHTALDILMKRIASFWLHSDYIYSWTKYKKTQDEIYKSIVALNDTVSCLVSLKKLARNSLMPSGELSNKEIHDEVNTMIAAGYDTTASTILLLFVALGSYPKAQEKVYQEKRRLTKFRIYDRFIKETMRLYPIVPLIFRTLDKDVDLKHCTLPAGDTCCISIYAANRHRVWGPDAEEFIPERWLEPSRVPHNALATFSFGKRGCIGNNYAMMSMKTTVVHMLRHYRIEADITKIKFKVDILSTPISGHFIRLHRR